MGLTGAPTPGAGDANIGFTLTPGQRTQLMRLMDSVVDGLAQSSGILTDRAGRIVEVARKPPGIQLPAISALAAGCYATTQELAREMGQSDSALIFQHENDQQVYIWPVAERALLVVLLKGAAAVETLEERLGGAVGGELLAVIREAKEPPKVVPPPRITPPEVPAELRHRTRALTALIMDLQAKRPKDFTAEVNAGLLHSRESLVQSLSRRDWRKAWEICEGTRQWLLVQMRLSQSQDVGQVLIRLYTEVFTYLGDQVKAAATPERIKILFASFHRFLAKQHPKVFLSERHLADGAVQVQAIWEAAKSQTPDPVELSSLYVPALDALVRELLRVLYLSKGADGRAAAMSGASAILKRYNLELLPFGLESQVGKDWTLLAPS